MEVELVSIHYGWTGALLLSRWGRLDALRKQALGVLERGNEDPRAFRVTSRYLLLRGKELRQLALRHYEPRWVLSASAREAGGAAACASSDREAGAAYLWLERRQGSSVLQEFGCVTGAADGRTQTCRAGV